MKILSVYIATDGRAFNNMAQCVTYEESLIHSDIQPYLFSDVDLSNIQYKLYNPKYDQNATCSCGHSYYRHFDSYEDNEACGCKYCDCCHFEKANP